MKFYWFFFLLLPFTGYSQNLVPNGSFEDTTQCPTTHGKIHYAVPWISPTAGTSDLIHSCSTNLGFNFLGFQLPHSGEAYAGIQLGNPIANTREYIEVPLLDTLEIGVCYLLTFYANLGHLKYSTDAIHAYFSDTLIDNVPFTNVMNYSPQIRNQTGNFLDTINWTLIQGEFEAMGGENYLIIGNFDSSAYCNWIYNDSTMTTNNSCYAKIDDIELIPAICTGLNESESFEFYVYPNPTSNNVTFRCSRNLRYTIILYSNLLSKIYYNNFIGDGSLDLQNEPSGIYFFQIWDNNTLRKSGKIIKIE